MNSQGFTFIEVLIAMVIFVIAALSAVDLTRGSVRATQEARDISLATWLLQKQIVELETKIEIEGFEKACEKTIEGKFNPPYEKYRWTASCDEIDFNISETAAKVAAQQDEETTSGSTTEDLVLKTILNMASDYVQKSMRELHVEVIWEQAKNKKSIDATTHLVRYDQALSVPGLQTGGNP